MYVTLSAYILFFNDVLKDPLTRWWLEEEGHGVG